MAEPEKRALGVTAPSTDAEATDGSKPAMASEPDQSLRYHLTRRQLISVFLLIWVMQFALAFSSGVFRVLTPYVTSSFRRHALTATTSVVANIVSGISRLPIAKLLDFWGRPQVMTLMVVCTTLGTVMMATCTNVETYCAAQVFYNLGYYGIQFCLIIFVADSTPLCNRGFLMGWMSTPSIAAIWAYGPATEGILHHIGFRWGFGMWSILIPVFCTPLLIIMFRFDKAAVARYEKDDTKKPADLKGKFLYYAKEFDAIGLLVLATGLSLLLLSLTIYSYQEDGWSSPLIICFLTFGGLCIIGLGLYEKYMAPVTFLPWFLIKNRTVIFTNVMAATLYTSEFLCSSYLYSVLVVFFSQSVTQATYISNIYLVGASFWNVLLGIALRYWGRIKIYTLAMGIPFFIIGTGLMIYSVSGTGSIGLMVFCKILFSFDGGTMYPIEQLAMMAVSQEHTAALIAVQGVVVDAGKAAGSAVGTAIWTATFKRRLIEHLPSTNVETIESIYGSIDVQSSFPEGGYERLGINAAYADTQRIILIVALSLLAVTWASVWFWEDQDVRKREDDDTEETSP